MNRYLAETETVATAYDDVLSGMQVAMDKFVKEMGGRMNDVTGPLGESILAGQLRTNMALIEEASGWVDEARLCLKAVLKYRDLLGSPDSNGGA